MVLSPLVITQLEQRLQKLIDDCHAIDAAVVTTIDGHMQAMKQRNKDYPLERLATMGSTLMSLGDTITAELEMGTCDNIISENKDGLVAFMHINNEMVLVTLGQEKSLGMLLSHSRRCAGDISKMV